MGFESWSPGDKLYSLRKDRDGVDQEERAEGQTLPAG